MTRVRSLDTHEALAAARKALFRWAEMTRSAGQSSAAEWEERALGTEAGKLVGSVEVDRVARLVWGIGCKPVR